MVVMASSLIVFPLLCLPSIATDFSLPSCSLLMRLLSFLTFLVFFAPIGLVFFKNQLGVYSFQKLFHFFFIFFSLPLLVVLWFFCSSESAFPSSFQHTKVWLFISSKRFPPSFSLAFSKLVFSSSQALKITTEDGNKEEFLPLLSCGEGTQSFFFPHVWEDYTSLFEPSYLMGRRRCHKNTTLHFYPFKVW